MLHRDNLNRHSECLGTASDVGKASVAGDDHELVVVARDPAQVDRGEQGVISAIWGVRAHNPLDVRSLDRGLVLSDDPTGGAGNDVVAWGDTGSLLPDDAPEICELGT